MKAKLVDREIFETFRVLTFFKFLFALSEFIAGIVIFAIGRNNLVNFVISVAQRELLEDGNGSIAGYIVNLAQNFSIKAEIFIALYLIIHGIVKIILLYGVWNRKKIAYPVSILVFSLFLIYQIRLYLTNFSSWLLVLSVIDLAYVALLIFEFLTVRKGSKPY
ncbi:Uncharacterised protein [uncultured archaeon]|nr:Uncharacterised protein [uncultured archaeon]